jgi:hypothetical protein
MKPKLSNSSFKKRAAEKAAARANDEAKLKFGRVSSAVMVRANSGSLRGALQGSI